jgi:rod shape-determining protein MreB
MSTRISDAVGLPVQVADDPLTAVARGTGYVLDNLEMLKQILDTAEDP